MVWKNCQEGYSGDTCVYTTTKKLGMGTIKGWASRCSPCGSLPDMSLCKTDRPLNSVHGLGKKGDGNMRNSNPGSSLR